MIGELRIEKWKMTSEIWQMKSEKRKAKVISVILKWRIEK